MTTYIVKDKDRREVWRGEHSDPASALAHAATGSNHVLSLSGLMLAAGYAAEEAVEMVEMIPARSSAREAGEVSEEELFEFIQESLMGTRGLEAAINNALISYHEDKISEMVLSIADVIEPTVRAALARFAAPRGRVVEGWLIPDPSAKSDSLFTLCSDKVLARLVANTRHTLSDSKVEIQPAMITILDAAKEG